MSQTTPPPPRHARLDEPEPPTAAIPSLFTDDTTQAIPVIPAQRSAPSSAPAAPPAPRRPETVREDRAVDGPPAGRHPVVRTVPQAPRRRVLPVVLAAVTAGLLAAGIAIGVGGTAGTEMTDQPSTSITP